MLIEEAEAVVSRRKFCEEKHHLLSLPVNTGQKTKDVCEVFIRLADCCLPLFLTPGKPLFDPAVLGPDGKKRAVFCGTDPQFSRQCIHSLAGQALCALFLAGNGQTRVLFCLQGAQDPAAFL